MSSTFEFWMHGQIYLSFFSCRGEREAERLHSSSVSSTAENSIRWAFLFSLTSNFHFEEICDFPCCHVWPVQSLPDLSYKSVSDNRPFSPVHGFSTTYVEFLHFLKISWAAGDNGWIVDIMQLEKLPNKRGIVCKSRWMTGKSESVKV